LLVSLASKTKPALWIPKAASTFAFPTSDFRFQKSKFKFKLHTSDGKSHDTTKTRAQEAAWFPLTGYRVTTEV
jgi:hypothetical protein